MPPRRIPGWSGRGPRLDETALVGEHHRLDAVAEARLGTAEVGYQGLIAAVTLILLVLTVSRLYVSARSPQPVMSATASGSPSTLTGASIGSPESQR